MSRSPIPGDPASITRLAGVTQAVARALAAIADSSVDVPADLGLSRRVARHLTQQTVGLQRGATLLRDELETVSTALLSQATALASAIADLRSLRERGERAGLTVVDGRWQPAWGITGAADPTTTVNRVELADRWQHDQDALVRTATRRRRELIQLLEESRTRLAAEAAHVRLG